MDEQLRRRLLQQAAQRHEVDSVGHSARPERSRREVSQQRRCHALSRSSSLSSLDSHGLLAASLGKACSAAGRRSLGASQHEDIWSATDDICAPALKARLFEALATPRAGELATCAVDPACDGRNA